MNNMFSGRSFEWWKAGISLNASARNSNNYQDENLCLLYADYKNQYIQEDYQQELFLTRQLI